MRSIFKKGDSRICENQRGITLMSHLCKIFTLIITKKTYKYCETINIHPECQCAVNILNALWRGKLQNLVE